MSTGALGIGTGLTASGSWMSPLSEAFPDPFLDMASLMMPETMQYALRWCEYIFMANGTYRQATDRVLSYFITDLEISDAGDDDKEKWKTFLDETLNVKHMLHTVGLDAMCFHGDVKAVTEEGIYKLRDLVDKQVNVLSQGGRYRPAKFKSFGKQHLLEVEFSDGRTILATPEHQWVAKNCSNKLVRVPTTSLRRGYSIERTVARRPEKNEEFWEGVRHGFTFCDGSLYNDGRQARVHFSGDKDAEILPHFAGYGNPPTGPDECGKRVIHGLPAHYKQLPRNEQSASYWYGFVCGFLAADGSADVQESRSALEAVAEQLPRIGMVCGPVRGYERTSEFVRHDGRVDVYCGNRHHVTLLKRFMLPQDFLLNKHRSNFENSSTETEYGRYIGIVGVRETGIVDEVFCCVEMETHTFVVENAILTGNCYGNSFTSVIPAFKRYLSCPRCFFEAPLSKVYNEPAFKFRWVNYEFHAYCPKCRTSGKWRHIDRRTKEDQGFYIKRWNPHEMELLWDPLTEENAYIWKIPEDYRKMIREGHLYHLERANWEVIQAVKHNNYILFDKDVVYHMREDALSGLRNRGWGISRCLANFRQAWYVQVLHRYNEAIALDYVIPFRLITPVPGDKTTGTDVLLNLNAGDFMSQVMSMIRRRRKDPAAWFSLPFPVQYQALGGDAQNLAPRELLDQGLDTLLNSIGVPAELYKGTLTMQSAPAALRLFESTWSTLPHNLNGWLRWIVTQVSQLLNWDKVGAKLMRVTHADDVQRQMSKLQLMMGGQISQSTGLKSVGLDFRDETQRMMEDQRYQAEEQAKLQEDMEHASQMEQMAQPPQAGAAPGAPPGPGGAPADAGAAPAAGASPGGEAATAGGGGPAEMAQQSVTANLPTGPNQPVTPDELQSRADYVASQIMSMPESQKDSELIKLKKVDATLHAIVKSKIDEYRQQAKTQGGAAMLQQMFGKQSSAQVPSILRHRRLRNIKT